MIQLKKRVTRLKIQHFLKENRLVLFFHYNIKPNSTKNKNLYDIKTQLLSLGQGSIFFVKNKIAQTLSQKQDIKDINFFPSVLWENKNRKTAQLPKRIQHGIVGCFIDKHVNLEPVQLLQQQIALFQGPNTLLGIESANQLHKILKFSKQEDTLVLLGGFYDNQAIDCVQLERLNLLSKQEQILPDLQLVRCMQGPVLQIMLALSIYPFCSISGAVRWRLMQTFNWRINQLSTEAKLRSALNAKGKKEGHQS